MLARGRNRFAHDVGASSRVLNALITFKFQGGETIRRLIF
jgi:hypothetical protein